MELAQRNMLWEISMDSGLVKHRRFLAFGFYHKSMSTLSLKIKTAFLLPVPT